MGSELTVLMPATAADLEAVAGERLARGILKAQMDDIQVQPGYDGLFGKICLWPGGNKGGSAVLQQARLPGT